MSAPEPADIVDRPVGEYPAVDAWQLILPDTDACWNLLLCKAIDVASRMGTDLIETAMFGAPVSRHFPQHQADFPPYHHSGEWLV